MHYAAKPEAIEWIFAVDECDKITFPDWMGSKVVTVTPGGSNCQAYNAAAEVAKGQILIAASDDIWPIQDWDKIIQERLGDTSTMKALFVSDGHRPDGLVVLQTVTRPWIEKHGSLFPRGFKSVYFDNWFMKQALRDGVAVEARDLVFEHRHPGFGLAQLDDVYRATNAPDRYISDRKLLDELLPPITISLCMICGNEEAIIERCLESAKGAFDELCLVRAIGENQADGTIKRATEWCKKNGKLLSSAEYTNKIPGLDHVDDFAAARNLSFELACSDWQLWLDCDDVLDIANCAGLRELAEEGRADAFAVMYAKPGGGNCLRERLIKRGKGRWKNRIHETCQIEGELVSDDSIQVMHTSPGNKHGSSHMRNLRLLNIALEDAPRHLFYQHEEQYRLAMKGDTSLVAVAIRTGKAALQLLDKAEERYEILLNLAELEPDQALDHLNAALRLQPWRREALAYLVQNTLARNDTNSAVSYFRMMDALPKPEPLPWTHRELWHTWGRNYLRVKILHARGQADQAAAEHARFMTDPLYAQRFETSLALAEESDNAA